MRSSTHTAVTAAAAVPSPKSSSTSSPASTSSPNNSASNATRSQWNKTFANGDSYSGEALHVNDKNQKPIKDGKGRYTWASSGAVYEGDWKGGRPHGRGTMTVPGNDGYVYTGDFVEGQRSGRGQCRFANGRTYDGEWKEDEMNGVGTVRGAVGVDDYEEYTGDFKNGKRSGAQGRCVYLNGDIYDGAWSAGKRQGMGEWQLHRPSSSLAVAPVRYKGPFDNDSPHTIGSAEAEVDYSDGSSYTGAVNAQLRRHGRGVHRLASGDVFEGSFAQDQREGRGTLQTSDGMICEGTWHRGQLDGEVRVTFSSPQNGITSAANDSRVVGAAQELSSDVRNLQLLRRSPYPLKSYEGLCSAGVLTGGPTTILYMDGSTYCGAVRHGLPHGAGVLRDRPFLYSSDDNCSEDGKERLRRRLSTSCISPAVSMMLLSYDGTFAAGEPSGMGTGEWQVATVGATAASIHAERVTAFNFSERLADGLRWWKASSYAALDGTYTGQWLRGLPHGRGTWQWADGSSYKGEVAFYLPSGHGTYSSSMEHYTGNFNDGQPNGKGAWEDRAQGISYDGEWSAGQPNGEGVCMVTAESNSSLCIGASRPPTSSGKSLTAPCTMVYEGSWENGRPSGLGRTYASTDRQRVVYDGHFVAGRCEGEGTLYFGSVRRGSISSEATTAAVHAYAQYCGVFCGGHPGGGPGCLTLKNNTMINGEFNADLQPCHGATITVRPHNEAWTFTGTFDATTRVGRGMMKFPNGDVYTGEVEDASADVAPGQQPSPQQMTLYNLQRHGQGVYKFVEGNQLQCTWRHNVLHGAGVYTTADGVKTERSYADGVLANDTVVSSVGASGGLGSVGTGGSMINVFTPENEFPNTLSEEALKSRLPEVHQRQQQQQQQRKRAVHSLKRRAEGRQPSSEGAAPPSSGPRHNSSAADGGDNNAANKSGKGTLPAPSLPLNSHVTLAQQQKQQHGAISRRGSSPPTSTRDANNSDGGSGRMSSACRKANDAATRISSTRITVRASGSTPSAAAAGRKYDLQRRTVSNKNNNASDSSPSSSADNSSGPADTKKKGENTPKGTPTTSNSVYLKCFQAGIRQLDHESQRSPSPSALSVQSSSPLSTAAGRENGPLRRRLGSALAAGREQQHEQPQVRRNLAPVSLQGSLKKMMTEACAIRNSREDEIHLLTEEMRQLNERIWQLGFVIANESNGDGGGGSNAKATTPKRGQPSSGRRASKNAEGARSENKEPPASRTQRLAALIQERRVIMEKLQCVVNAP